MIALSLTSSVKMIKKIMKLCEISRYVLCFLEQIDLEFLGLRAAVLG